MALTVYAHWHKSELGYYIGYILVYDTKNKVLMCDEDMYYTLDKFMERLNRQFINNKRFNWHKVKANKKDREIYMFGVDTK